MSIDERGYKYPAESKTARKECSEKAGISQSREHKETDYVVISNQANEYRFMEAYQSFDTNAQRRLESYAKALRDRKK